MSTAKERARELAYELLCTSEVVKARAEDAVRAIDRNDFARAAEILASCVNSADLITLRHDDAVTAVAKARFE